MNATCAWCGWRECFTVRPDTDDNDRVKPICGVCLVPATAPDDYEYEPADLADRFDPGAVKSGDSTNHTTRDAVLATVQKLGACTTKDIAIALGAEDIHSREYDVITQCLRRLKKRGALLAEPYREGLNTRGHLYRMPRTA